MKKKAPAKAKAKAPAKKKPAPPKKKVKAEAPQVLAEEQDGGIWKLRLYVAGQTPKSVTAFANLKRMCEIHLKGRYKIEVVDLLKDPQLAQGDQILAIPTLVRKLPAPMKKVIGDLSNQDRFLVGLDLKIQDGIVEST